mgnify:CR=1 FL=1
MIKVSYTLIALSCLAFVMAVIGSVFNYDFFGVDPEGISRASNNLALIAIALVVCLKKA